MRGWSDSVALTMWGGIGESVAIRVAVAAFPMVQPSDKALPRPAQEAGGRSQAVDPARRAIDEAMERYARGEVAAFDQLYGMAAPRVRGFLLRMCGNFALAEDLTQETFFEFRARGAASKNAPRQSLEYLDCPQRSLRSRPARAHAGRGRQQGRSVSRSAGDPDTRGDEVLSGRELFDVVRAALDELTVQQREAFVLLRFEGMSVAEAAMVLGTTPGAVKSGHFERTKRCARRLKRAPRSRGSAMRDDFDIERLAEIPIHSRATRGHRAPPGRPAVGGLGDPFAGEGAADGRRGRRDRVRGWLAGDRRSAARPALGSHVGRRGRHRRSLGSGGARVGRGDPPRGEPFSPNMCGPPPGWPHRPWSSGS